MDDDDDDDDDDDEKMQWFFRCLLSVIWIVMNSVDILHKKSNCKGCCIIVIYDYSREDISIYLDMSIAKVSKLEGTPGR